jgi:hypothetical protein
MRAGTTTAGRRGRFRRSRPRIGDRQMPPAVSRSVACGMGGCLASAAREVHRLVTETAAPPLRHAKQSDPSVSGQAASRRGCRAHASVDDGHPTRRAMRYSARTARTTRFPVCPRSAWTRRFRVPRGSGTSTSACGCERKRSRAQFTRVTWRFMPPDPPSGLGRGPCSRRRMNRSTSGSVKNDQRLAPKLGDQAEDLRLRHREIEIRTGRRTT